MFMPRKRFMPSDAVGLVFDQNEQCYAWVIDTASSDITLEYCVHKREPNYGKRVNIPTVWFDINFFYDNKMWKKISR